jgi:hypothetical protein
MVRDAVLYTSGCLAVLIFCGCTAATAATLRSIKPEAVTLGGILSADSNDTPVFSRDGNTAFFDRSSGATKTILVSRRVNGRWSAPQVAPFSGHWYDQDPVVSPDDSFLIFGSDRPVPGTDHSLVQNYFGKANPGSNLWKVARKGKAWGAPTWLGAAINSDPFIDFPEIAGDGSLYFMRREGGVMHIFHSEYKEGRYLPPTQVAIGDPSITTHDPAVARDQSFMVFDYGKTPVGLGRLCISIRQGDQWGKPQDLGDVVNQDAPWGARLAPDQRTLYFTGSTHIWRISLKPWLSAPGAMSPCATQSRRGALSH